MFVSRRAILQAGLLMPAANLLPFGLSAADNGFASGFTHSVASGDPSPFGVRLWTRYVTPAGNTKLRVEISEAEDFGTIASQADTTAGPASDFCAHIQVEGLKSGRWYFYRFIAPGGIVSPIGRTKTLPIGSVDRYRIGVVSCANATSGWFNAYAHAADRDDLDLIVHLGDYIYESPVDRSDALAELAVSRGIAPQGEATRLLDYRLRYASYRRDPALMELHRRVPMIVVWDDHETANNSWHGGAKNHDPVTEGPWSVRKAAGLRAFREWLPMGSDPYAEYRIGDLASLFRLETRLLARSEQLDIGDAIRGRKDVARAVQEFSAGPLGDPGRTLLGGRQEEWLANGLAASVDSGKHWQVLLQQVIMAPTILPQISANWFGPGFEPTVEEQRERVSVNALSALGVPFGLDRWDGYPAARDRLLEASATANANLVVLSADSHNAWAYDLQHRGRAVGVEFAVHSVTSLGLDKRFDGNPRSIAQDFIRTNPSLKWCDTSRRGYMTIQLTPDRVEGHWHFIPSRKGNVVQLVDEVRLVSPRGAQEFA